MAVKRITLMDVVVGMLLGTCMMAGIFSCAGSSAPVWPGHPAYPAGQGSDPKDFQRFFIKDQYSIVLGNNPKYSLAMVDKDNTSLLLQTDLESSGAVKNIPGVVLNDAEGGSLVVRFDERGWPKHAVYHNPVLGSIYFYFVNWTDTSVEIMVIDPSNYYYYQIRVTLDSSLRFVQGVLDSGFPRYSGFLDLDKAYPYQDRRINEQKISSSSKSDYPGLAESRRVNFYSGAYSVTPRVLPKVSAPPWQSEESFRVSVDQLAWASAAAVVVAAASGTALRSDSYYNNGSSMTPTYVSASDFYNAITYASEQIGVATPGEISPVTNPDDCIYAPVNPWILATNTIRTTDSVILPSVETAYDKTSTDYESYIRSIYDYYLPGGYPDIVKW